MEKSKKKKLTLDESYLIYLKEISEMPDLNDREFNDLCDAVPQMVEEILKLRGEKEKTICTKMTEPRCDCEKCTKMRNVL